MSIRAGALTISTINGKLLLQLSTLMSNTTTSNAVVHPKHYNVGNIEVIEFIVGTYNLNFNLGNAIKYICRAAHKGKELEDLRKAEFYLNDELARRTQRYQPLETTPRHSPLEFMVDQNLPIDRAQIIEYIVLARCDQHRNARDMIGRAVCKLHDIIETMEGIK